ncbi:uncharacterized protein [Drosophila suzukii]|uniref:Uncharacterized protein n=1 Tax=Drosophila suzukii TaxID=28584 RepID=A0ABM4TR15_DROSZ
MDTENRIDEMDDEAQLKTLLKSFNLEAITENLKSCGITYRSLKYINTDDIRDAISNVGLRAEFREKLFFWRKSEFNIDDKTISADSKVSGWLKEQTSTGSSIQSAVAHLNISNILQLYPKGQGLLHYYETKNVLTNVHREDLISVIVEHAIATEFQIRTSEFPLIVDQIVSIFPTESEVRDFYFIPRSGKKNPAGKLYAKYTNNRTKRIKLDRILEVPVKDQTKSQKWNLLDFEETLYLADKTELMREISDWKLVLEKWNKTHLTRRKDVKTLDGAEFLKAWPKYADSRAPELIQIDFKLLFPGREDALSGKWENFKEKISLYYESNIHGPSSKELLKTLTKAENIDSTDFILTILLPSVLPSNTWFSSKTSRSRTKYTLLDSQESLVLRVNSIVDYQQRIADIISKNYSNLETVQPFVFVEGQGATSLKSFFVYFDKTIYKFDSFIQSLDICFKIFNTLDLKYPPASELSWNFIQQYFYNIYTEYDKKSANLSSLLSFLKS